MIYFINNSTDPAFNIAVEELLAKDETINDEILLLWQNDNAIIIGRNQNTFEEINHEYVKNHQVKVVRRLSGGGAVYHDLGNLSFTFIFNKNKDNMLNYKLFTQPIINVLKKLGLNAEFSGKNDILVDGKKISGNAQFVHNNRIVHHGTILFNLDLDKLQQVLKPDLQKLASKGIKSMRSRVSNVLPLLEKKITISEFKALIVAELKNDKNVEIRSLSPALIAKAEQLANQKYRTWEWNYGNSPFFNLANKVRFENKGTVDVRLDVDNGIIKKIKIYGDFLGSLGTELIEQKLQNVRFNYEEIDKFITESDIEHVFGSAFSKAEIMNVIIK